MNKVDFYENNFDLLRLLAAFQVMFMHSLGYLELSSIPPFFGKIFSFFPGVNIFFVISGFLISASLERVSNIFVFAKNRFLRIYPALWVSIIIAIICMLMFYDKNVGWIEILKWLLAKATIFQFYNNSIFAYYGIGNLNGTLWTISVEIQFYILLPVLYKMFKIERDYILYFILILSFISNILYLNIENSSILSKLFGVSVFPYLYIFLIGVLLQRNFSFVNRFLVNKSLYWGILYITVAYLSTTQNIIDVKLSSSILIFVLAFFIISFAYSHVHWNNVLKGNDLSYGIYIYHLIITNIFIEICFVGKIQYFMFLSIIVLLLSYASWKLIETPSLRLKHKFFILK